MTMHDHQGGHHASAHAHGTQQAGDAQHVHLGSGGTELPELLDLDYEVLYGYWTGALSWLRRVAGAGRRRVLDLGAGTGTGTIGLAQWFGGAEVIAVDAEEGLLERIRVKALNLGLADRVHTVQADLDAGWPGIDGVDVAWASMSLHHLADPDRVLAELAAAIRPGGLLAVAEFEVQLRFLPDDLGFGRPGLEQRCLDLLHAEHAHSLPELGSDWAPRLDRAGFTVLAERPFQIELNPSHSAAAIDYAWGWLHRLRSGLADRLASDDLDALTVLLDGDGPESLRRRDDLQIRGCRTITLVQRP
jgi:SAM-dependent methyltransferase